MSTLFIVLHLLAGHGAHARWQTFKHHEVTTQSMLCNDRARDLRAELTGRKGQRIEVFCRREPDRV